MKKLNSKQMASFVARGYLQADGLVPGELDRRVLEEMRAGAYEACGPTRLPLEAAFAGELAMSEVLALPRLRGIVESLVGPEPSYLFHVHHLTPAKRTIGNLGWHSDEVLGRHPGFPIKLFYFPQDTPREMGGTMILPGSHLLRAAGGDINHIHNIRGQYPIVCSAGTVVILHHNIWHCAQPNSSEVDRHMLKIGIGPSSQQTLTWDVRDLNDPQVSRNLGWSPPWVSGDMVIGSYARQDLWRYLTAGELPRNLREESVPHERYRVSRRHKVVARPEAEPARDGSGRAAAGARAGSSLPEHSAG